MTDILDYNHIIKQDGMIVNRKLVVVRQNLAFLKTL